MKRVLGALVGLALVAVAVPLVAATDPYGNTHVTGPRPINGTSAMALPVVLSAPDGGVLTAQPVSGTVTCTPSGLHDVRLRAPDGGAQETQAVSGTVTCGPGGLYDVRLRAPDGGAQETQPVSGTVTCTPSGVSVVQGQDAAYPVGVVGTVDRAGSVIGAPCFRLVAATAVDAGLPVAAYGTDAGAAMLQCGLQYELKASSETNIRVGAQAATDGTSRLLPAKQVYQNEMLCGPGSAATIVYGLSSAGSSNVEWCPQTQVR